MANVDSPYGLKPVEHLNGNPWNGATRRCRVDDTAGDLGVGDAVVWNGAGYQGYPEIVGATVGDGNKIFGVIVSFEPQVSNLERLYIASADSGWANVCVDPDVVYSIQANGVVGDADIGQNAVLVSDHTVDTTTGLSGMEMNATTAANASYQLTIIGGVVREDNDLTLTHAEWLVIINLHSLRAVDANAGGAAEGAAGV
jgi:hypothetical protein